MVSEFLKSYLTKIAQNYLRIHNLDQILPFEKFILRKSISTHVDMFLHVRRYMYVNNDVTKNRKTFKLTQILNSFDNLNYTLSI